MFLYTNFACSFHWDMWQHGTLAFVDSNRMIFKKGEKNQENFDPKSHHTHFIFAQIHNLVPDMKNLYNFALANYFKCQKLDLICPNQICQIKSLFCSFLPVEPQVGLTQPTFYTTYNSQGRLPVGWGVRGRSKHRSEGHNSHFLVFSPLFVRNHCGVVEPEYRPPPSQSPYGSPRYL